MTTSRSRIVVWLAGLVAVSLLAIVLTTRSILLAAIPHDAAAEVDQELAEFTAFTGTGVDPTTTRPFTSPERILQVYLERETPSPNEAIVGLRDGEIIAQAAEAPRALEEGSPLITHVTNSPLDSGVFPPDGGRNPVHWGTVEVSGADNSTVTFLVARFTEGAYAEVTELVTTLSLVSAGVFLLALVAAWVLSGRLLAPVRQVASHVRRDMDNGTTTPCAIDGTDEISELARSYQEGWVRLRTSGKINQAIAAAAARQIETARETGNEAETLRATAASLSALAELTPGFRGTTRTATRPQSLARHAGELIRDELPQVAVTWSAAPDERLDVNTAQVTAALVNGARVLADNGAQDIHIAAGESPHTVTLRAEGLSLNARQAESMFSWPLPDQPLSFSGGPSTYGAVVRATTDAHGGLVRVESSPLDGTTVTLHLSPEALGSSALSEGKEASAYEHAT